MYESNDALSPPTNRPNPQPSAESKRLRQTQVDEVVGIMSGNVEKVLERDQKLSELDDRAVVSWTYEMQHQIQQTSPIEQQVERLKRDIWWKNFKMLAIIIGVIFIKILAILIVFIIVASGVV